MRTMGPGNFTSKLALNINKCPTQGSTMVPENEDASIESKYRPDETKRQSLTNQTCFHSLASTPLAAEWQGIQAISTACQSPAMKSCSRVVVSALQIQICPYGLNVEGCDGVRFWNLKTMKEVCSPRPSVYHGQITCVAWVTCRDDHDELLCYTTALGYIGFIRQREVKTEFGIRW
jgi:hypothetical protein